MSKDPGTTIMEDRVVDASGLLCPMPIVRAARAMKEMEPGQVMKLVSTDRGSEADVPAWADDAGHALVSTRREGEALVFFVRRGEDA